MIENRTVLWYNIGIKRWFSVQYRFGMAHHKQPKLNDEKVNKHPGLLHEGGFIAARISFSLTLALGVYRTVGMSPFLVPHYFGLRRTSLLDRLNLLSVGFPKALEKAIEIWYNTP